MLSVESQPETIYSHAYLWNPVDIQNNCADAGKINLLSRIEDGPFLKVATFLPNSDLANLSQTCRDMFARIYLKCKKTYNGTQAKRYQKSFFLIKCIAMSPARNPSVQLARYHLKDIGNEYQRTLRPFFEKVFNHAVYSNLSNRCNDFTTSLPSCVEEQKNQIWERFSELKYGEKSYVTKYLEILGGEYGYSRFSGFLLTCGTIKELFADSFQLEAYLKDKRMESSKTPKQSPLFLQKLHFTASSGNRVSCEGLSGVMAKISNIQTLVFSNFPERLEGLDELNGMTFEHLTQLQELSIQRSHAQPFMAKLINQCLTLRSICFEEVTFPEGFLRGCSHHHLDSLVVSGGNQTLSFPELIGNFPNAKEYRLTCTDDHHVPHSFEYQAGQTLSIRSDRFDGDILDRFFASFDFSRLCIGREFFPENYRLQRLDSVRELVTSDSCYRESLGPETILQLVQACPHLKKLFYSFPFPTVQGNMSILSALPESLQSIQLGSFNTACIHSQKDLHNPHLKAILQKKQITEITLDCALITDDVEIPEDLSHIKKLTIRLYDQTEASSRKIISCLLDRTTKLHALNIAAVRGTVESREILDHIPFSSLKDLHLDGIFYTQKQLRKGLRQAGKLKQLKVSHHPHLIPQTFSGISLPSLKLFKVDMCPLLQSKQEEILTMCQKGKSLELPQVNRILFARALMHASYVSAQQLLSITNHLLGSFVSGIKAPFMVGLHINEIARAITAIVFNSFYTLASCIGLIAPSYGYSAVDMLDYYLTKIAPSIDAMDKYTYLELAESNHLT
jgi:hypothetical protein